MLKQFKSYIEEHQLFSEDNNILLAVSGGIDSVVMTHLFKLAGYKFGIAHCNFMLRGTESDIDEDFCRQLGKKLDVPFLSISFNTRMVAKERGISTQMAARDLRYEWFDEVCIIQGYDYVAAAHHLNDSIETFLFNFSKGCGIRGLHGIPVKNGDRIRPLLFATREEIERWAVDYKIQYREDASNAEKKYARNRIRHDVIPALKSINPSFEISAAKTIHRLLETEQLFDFAIEHFKSLFIKQSGDSAKIDLDGLVKAPGSKTLLFEIIKEFGFNADQVDLVISSNTSSGAIFYSNTHQMLLNRGNLEIIPEPEEEKEEVYFIVKGDHRVTLENGILQFDYKEGRPDTFSTDPNFAYMDTEKLKFPLRLRNWKHGDSFQPLGMKGESKKIKDFFTDSKLSIFDKKKVLILENTDGEVIWIIGHRADERFKITENTSNYAIASFIPKVF
jgi:tRNA(Ile)-lysidine synthase